MPAPTPPRARAGLLAALAVIGLALTGCANFSQSQGASDWRPQTTLPPEQGPNPHIPGMPNGVPGAGGPPASQSAVPPPNGCTDYNPAVVATCLNPISAVVALPASAQNASALAAERRTGKVLQVAKDTNPTTVQQLSVDPIGDGGLTGLALSPTYSEDQIVYAYLTTPTDNRLVRFAPGDTAKPVLAGIPRGNTGNRGALAVDPAGALLVATGDAGKPADADNPNSLAGKVLRIDTGGRTSVIASGLHAPGGICTSSDGKMTWITDQALDHDVLYRLRVGQPLGSPAWTWPGHPGVSGCAAFPHSVMVAASTAANLQSLPLNPDGSFAGTPQITMTDKDGFGRLTGMSLATDRFAIAGTANKDGGKPVSSDDRVVIILPQSSSDVGKD